MELTRLIRVAAVVAATAMASATMAEAQGVPAEVPPANFAGGQYIDSRGCVFVRVGVAANTQWVPRVGRDRRQICGQTPTMGGQRETAAAPSAQSQPGVTVIGAAPTAAATTTSRPAATATRPAVPQQPAVRSVATTPRPMATQPRSVATTPRPTPEPQREAPAATGACANLPADARPYFTGPNPRCGPQAVHPGDAARGLDRTSSLDGGSGAAIRQLVRYEVNPPAGYRAAWDDDRLNPYRGLAVAGGQRQMEQVWTNTLPRRLVGDPPPRGFRALFAQPNRPAEIVPARVTVIRP